MSDARIIITEQEHNEIVKAYFKEGEDGRLTVFPTKVKRKVVILKQLIQRFDSQRQYSEKEVNEVLNFRTSGSVRNCVICQGFKLMPRPKVANAS